VSHSLLAFSTDARTSVFADEAARRRAVRALAGVAGPRLRLFALGDRTLHVVATARGADAGRLGRDLRLALRPLSAVPMDPARIRPVEGPAHLQALLAWLLGQPARDGVPVHPALWTGSCFPDLAGARLLPGYRPDLGEWLPRLPRHAAFRAAGLPPDGLDPATDASVRAAGAARVRDAAAAALAVDPDLVGREAPVVAARAAACALAHGAGAGNGEIARVIGVPLRTVQRLVHRAVPAILLDAVRRRLALEDIARLYDPIDHTAWSEIEPPAT